MNKFPFVLLVLFFICGVNAQELNQEQSGWFLKKYSNQVCTDEGTLSCNWGSVASS
ncbi:MAG TPA: hypothetical protein VGO58_20415 [Chitinophagaceae bacterium]|jgi:hypothetical protein|nr:hypothetical protein [Chitinophagaceae bacterium]